MVFVATGLMLASEMFNTTIEAICDFLESAENKKIGIIKDILSALWAVSPVNYYRQPPSGLVAFGAIILGLFTGIVATLVILFSNYFWLEISKHAHAAPPRLFAGAVLGLAIFFFRTKIWLRIEFMLMAFGSAEDTGDSIDKTLDCFRPRH